MKNTTISWLRILTAFIFISFCTYKINAQNNLQEAYIINKSLDTLSGYLDYQNWENNPKEIKFQLTKTGSPKTYSVDDIISFKVNGEKYFAQDVEIEVSPRTTYKINAIAGLRLIEDRVFVKTIMQGEKSLYYLKTADGIESFYIGTEKDIELLVFKKYLTLQGRKSYAVENNKYKGQLRKYLSNCQNISNKFKRLEYNGSALRDLFEYYYDCETPTYLKEKSKNDYVLGAFAGITNTSLKFNSSNRKYLSRINYPSSLSFTGGLSGEFAPAVNLKKWSLKTELAFSYYNSNATYIEDLNNDNSTTTNTEFEFTYLKFNNIIGYKYWLNENALLFGAGFSYGMLLQNKNERKITTKFFSSVTEETRPAIEFIKSFEIGFLFDIGFRFKKSSVILRYETGNGMSQMTSVKSTVNRLSAIYTYTL